MAQSSQLTEHGQSVVPAVSGTIKIIVEEAKSYRMYGVFGEGTEEKGS